MIYLGDFVLGSTFDFKFNTTDAADAPITVAGGTLVAYPGNSVTEITTGLTLTADFDGRTGLHNVRVVATSGNGYAVATNYAIAFSAGTVDGVSVIGRVIAHFSIQNRPITLVNPQGVQKNTALTGVQFPMYTTAGVLATGVAVTLTRSIDGAAFAAATNSPAEIGTTGIFQVNLSAADLNGNTIMFRATATGCAPSLFTIRTVTP